MKIAGLVISIILIVSLSFFIGWNIFKIVQTLRERKKSKVDIKDDEVNIN